MCRLRERIRPWRILLKIIKCGQTFTRKEKLENHIKSCGSILKQEVEKVNSGPFKCSTCDKSFIKNKYLKLYVKTHEAKKQRDPLESLKYYDCGKEFDKLKSLKADKKTHNENLSLPCNH